MKIVLTIVENHTENYIPNSYLHASVLPNTFLVTEIPMIRTYPTDV